MSFDKKLEKYINFKIIYLVGLRQEISSRCLMIRYLVVTYLIFSREVSQSQLAVNLWGLSYCSPIPIGERVFAKQ